MSWPELRQPRDQRGAAGLRIVLVALLVVVLAAAAGVVWYGSGSEPQTPAAGLPPDSSSPTTVAPELDLPEVVAPGEVLPAAPSVDPQIAADQLRPVLSALVSSRALGRHAVVQVSTPGAARPIWTSGVPPAVTPASTMKLLTSMAALDQLGPQHRFETTVTQGAKGNDIVLVGGGDPLLTDRVPRGGDPLFPAPATLASLAKQTANALRTAGVARVRLSYDASLFTGPAVSPYWPASYISESIVAPISALWVDEGRAVPGLAQRVPDPAATAAQRFAGLLQARGIKAQLAGRGTARPDAEVVAAVQSAPLEQIVQHVLEVSDNEGAEVLFRQAAIGAGRPASFEGGAAAVRETMAEYGIPIQGAVIHDGSGLSRDDQLPIATLVDVLGVAADPANPDLRPVVSTLPVAGFSGSLDSRFVEVAPGGLGRVRAKTGTLTGVHGLAGLATTRRGHVLLFAAVADQVPVPRTLAARAQLDRIAAALASCRC